MQYAKRGNPYHTFRRIASGSNTHLLPSGSNAHPRRSRGLSNQANERG